jgi:hypothetical protein
MIEMNDVRQGNEERFLRKQGFSTPVTPKKFSLSGPVAAAVFFAPGPLIAGRISNFRRRHQGHFAGFPRPYVSPNAWHRWTDAGGMRPAWPNSRLAVFRNKSEDDGHLESSKLRDKVESGRI